MIYVKRAPHALLLSLSLPFITYTNLASADNNAQKAVDNTTEYILENPNSDLESMTITASRIAQPLRQVGSSVSVLTTKDLEVKNYLSLSDTLRTLPSVRASNSGGLGKNTAIRIRGEESYRTLLLIDGINVSDTTSPQIAPRFDHLLNSQFDRVEVLRGPQGLLYGADAAGVVSVFSKRAQAPLEIDAAIEAGSFNTRNINGNIRGKNDIAHYSLSLADVTSDGFNTRTDDVTEDDDGYENTTVHFTAGMTPSKNLGANITLRHVDSLSNYDNCDYFTPDFALIEADDCVADYVSTSGKLSGYYLYQNTKHDVSYATTETKNFSFGSESGEISSDNRGRITQAQYVGNADINDSLNLTWGLDNKIEHYENFRYPSSHKRDQIGIYLEAQSNIAKRFYFTVGARQDDNEDFGKHNSVRVSSAYLIPIGDNELKIKTVVGTGFRAPSLFEVYSTQNNNIDFTPEESTGYEAGVEFISSTIHAEITAFYSTITDEIYYDNTTFNYNQSSGDTLSKGIDISLNTFIGEHWTINTNYTFNETDVDNNTGNRNVRARRPKHAFNAGIHYTLLNNTVNIAVNYRNNSDMVDYDFFDTPTDIDDYDTFDISASWQAIESLQIYLRILNLLEEDYVEVPNYNTAGLSAYTGIRYTF